MRIGRILCSKLSKVISGMTSQRHGVPKGQNHGMFASSDAGVMSMWLEVYLLIYYIFLIDNVIYKYFNYWNS